MGLRIPDWLIYGGILVVMVAYANRGDGITAPPPPSPELGPLLPSESPRDERILVQVDAPTSGVGTAFATSTTGDWVTARHVVDSCDTVALKISSQRLLRVDNTVVSPTADLAALRTGWTRAPLPADLRTQRQIGEVGYFFGFPQGKPGEVVGSLMSRGRMQVRGRYRTDEGVLIWSEIGRTGGLRGGLGGLSGAPVLDADGEVIGVVAAETPRRGRIYTVSPRQLRAVIPRDGLGTATPVDLDSYALQADRLRRDRRVAQVVCLKD